jgi:cellulose synthase/poly-beta-1,6-N-acetylglucosamine synthase-like glycosyltransferase
METLVEIVSWLASVIFVLYLYDLGVSLAGFLPLASPQPPRKEGPRARFAAIICAHNEELVIEAAVRSLREQDYPADRIDVYVVADNCKDTSAARARAAGAIVLERTDTTRRGKGYALQWGIQEIIERGTYDALAIFDADNVVAPNFMAVMEGHLAAGERAIQAYLDTKNPKDTWVTRSIALAYFVTNRFWMRARMRLGLSATLGGTGCCLAWSLVLSHHWDPGALTDDLDLTVELVLAGERVTYTPYARTYDEKPLTVRQSLRQRTRWMQGHSDVALRSFLALMREAFRRSSFRCLDLALYLLQPMRLALSFGTMVVLLAAKLIAPDMAALQDAFWFTPPAIGLAALFFVVYPLVGAAAEGVLPLAVRSFPQFFLFAFTWVPAVFVGLLKMRKRVWDKTEHSATFQAIREPPRANPPAPVPAPPPPAVDPERRPTIPG